MIQRKTPVIFGYLEQWPWLEAAAFLAPLIVHMLVPQLTGMFFDGTDPAAEANAYTASVTAQVVAAVLVFWLFCPVWLDHFPFRVTWAWIGSRGCWLSIVGRHLQPRSGAIVSVFVRLGKVLGIANGV